MTNALARPETPEAVSAIGINLVEHLCQVRRFTGATVEQRPRLTWHCSGIADGFFNGVSNAVLESATVHLEVARLRQEFGSRGLWMTWYVDQDSRPGDLAGRLVKLGFEPLGTLLGMNLPLDDFQSPEGPRDIGRVAVEEVLTRAQMRTFLKVIEASSPHPLPAGIAPILDIYTALGFGARLRHHVLSADGQAVAVATSFEIDGVVGLYHVHTTPNQRCRGYGTAVSMHAIEEARSGGARLAVVHSTAVAERLYGRLGFTRRTTIAVLGAAPARRQ
ncbi:MAG: GNAT family N-acetyltransferase [Candidatus Dormibacteria bacterium]